ncbi:MAG: metalloregulator ArsR/SmtB family transcription factor [Chloroflexota bacterium]
MSQNPPDLSEITLLDTETSMRLAEVFAVLADPSRLRIISALSHHELNVGDLAELVGMSQPATSHHLRLLRTQRIVRMRKVGRQTFYALDDTHIHDLLDRGIAHVQHE